MCDVKMQKSLCAAPECDRHTADTTHCRNHSKEFLPMYNKYKAKQSEIDKYIDDPKILSRLPIERLLWVLNKLLAVVELRKKYRQQAFRVEYHDKGHEIFIEKLVALSDMVIGVLTKKFQSPNEPEKLPDEDDSSTESDTELASPVVVKSYDKLITRLTVDKKDLEEELSKMIAMKSSHITVLREQLMDYINHINKMIKTPLHIDDRETRLLYHSTALINLSFDNAFDLIEGSVNGKLQIIPFIVVNWEMIPLVDTVIEGIYNGKAQHPEFSYEDHIIMGLIGLINESRKYLGNFSFRFSPRTEGLVLETQPHDMKYYPAKYKKKMKKFVK
ncbi:Hypothetical protein POVR1_LOCUS556 [uncultured virus]|nr:Hypothetical protein POVR1_LOCUS556 [uncultured virus]